MNDRRSVPLLILDVDGVINIPDKSAVSAGRQGLHQERYEFERAPISTTVTWDPAVVDRINALVDAGAVKPLWCTMWREDANGLARLVGLHREPWPVIWAEGHNDQFDPAGWSKSIAVVRTTLGRDYVWVDDDITPWAEQVHAARPRAGRSLLVRPDTAKGLTIEELDSITGALAAWRADAVIERRTDR